jgi:hypothetical protein
MKTTILSILIFLSCIEISLAGSSLSPEGVVRAAIVAAHQDRLSYFVRCCDISAISTDPKHPMSADSLIALFKNLNEAESQFEPRAANEDSERVTVRMTAPRRVDFELVGTNKINGVLWRIVMIHP